MRAPLTGVRALASVCGLRPPGVARAGSPWGYAEAQAAGRDQSTFFQESQIMRIFRNATGLSLCFAALFTACADGTLSPRAADDPVNPRAPETPAIAAATAATAAADASAPPMQDMPGMSGMDHAHMQHMHGVPTAPASSSSGTPAASDAGHRMSP